MEHLQTEHINQRTDVTEFAHLGLLEDFLGNNINGIKKVL